MHLPPTDTVKQGKKLKIFNLRLKSLTIYLKQPTFCLILDYGSIDPWDNDPKKKQGVQYWIKSYELS